MPDQSDPTRDLLRRAYRGDDLDSTAGLLDVLRRADPPPIEIPVHGPSPHPPTRPVSRRRDRLPVVAAFAAVILVILIGVAVTARGRGGDGTLVGSPPSTAIDRTTAPTAMPTQCASAWGLTMRDREFHVTERSPGCAPLPIDRLYLVDVARGNGVIEEGAATVWPLTPTGVTTPTVSAPFTFTVDGWPGPIAGHFYEVWYAAGERTANAGDDATVLWQSAYVVSVALPYPCVDDPRIQRTC